MLPGSQILKSLELPANTELDDGSVAVNSGNANENFLYQGRENTYIESRCERYPSAAAYIM